MIISERRMTSFSTVCLCVCIFVPLLFVAQPASASESGTASNSVSGGASAVGTPAGKAGMGLDSGLESPFGSHPALTLSESGSAMDCSAAVDIGVKWARETVYAYWFLVQPNLNEDKYDFAETDRQFRSIPPGIHILANVAPQMEGGDKRCRPGEWVPADEARYTAFVRATVERYDGDGTNDMPGLVNPILYWQVGNEPNFARDRFLDTRNFADLQRITYKAIKSACPEAVVLIGGVASDPRDYVKNMRLVYGPIMKQLNGQYVDAFDFHWYGTADGDYRLHDRVTGANVIKEIRAMLEECGYPRDFPIWCTENGTYSGEPHGEREHPFQSERQQAGDIFKRYIYSLSCGVKKVFRASGMTDGFFRGRNYFSFTGIIRLNDDGSRGPKKLGYYTFKKMTERLEGADWNSLVKLHDGTGSDHVYVFSITNDRRSLMIAWWDSFEDSAHKTSDAKVLDLNAITGRTVFVETVVPLAATGGQIEDYATAFRVRSYPVVNKTVRIVLNGDPVFIHFDPAGMVEVEGVTQIEEPDRNSKEQRPRAGNGRPKWENLLRDLDGNGDGRISRDEFRGPKDLFVTLDKDKDGYVTKQDMGDGTR